jgi:Family of unknown function (DUF6152)
MRNGLLVFPATIIFLLLSLGGSTFAHHGFVSWFDTSRSVAVKGTVTSFDWTNPHAYIYFDGKDEKGNIEKWNAELGALNMLARAGWRRDTLKPGDEITAIGNPAKDGKPVMHLTKIVLANGQELSSAL